MSIVWEFQHSVIADARRQTVWEFISNIDNLARVEGDAVESMTLDGPFQAGTKGDDEAAWPGAHALAIGRSQAARSGRLRDGAGRGRGPLCLDV
jgi:hypothetical protein